MVSETINFLRGIINDADEFDGYTEILNKKIKHVITELLEIDDYISNDIW